MLRTKSVSELTELLTMCSTLVGISQNNLPTRDTMYVICDSVVKYFGTLTDKECKTAFEMAAASITDVEEHYQQYSFKYIASIFNAFKSQINGMVKNNEIRFEELPEIKNDEKEVDWSDTLNYFIEVCKNEGIEKTIVPEFFYDWLIKTNRINPTKDEKINAFEICKEKLKFESLNLQINERQLLFEKIKDKSSIEYINLINQAKKLIVKNYIKSQV